MPAAVDTQIQWDAEAAHSTRKRLRRLAGSVRSARDLELLRKTEAKETRTAARLAHERLAAARAHMQPLPLFDRAPEPSGENGHAETPAGMAAEVHVGAARVPANEVQDDAPAEPPRPHHPAPPAGRTRRRADAR